MVPGSYRRGGWRALLAAMAGVFLLWLTPAATAQASSTAPHRVDCVLAGGRLYLGSPGAVTNPKFVTCAVRFYQVRPRSDGVIVALQYARHTSTYSILKFRLIPIFGRFPIRWLHHPGPAKLGCALSGGQLYLGSTGPSHPRKKVTCSVSLYQLAPAADGVIAVLTEAHHTSTYSVVLRQLPHHPAGYLAIPWIT